MQSNDERQEISCSTDSVPSNQNSIVSQVNLPKIGAAVWMDDVDHIEGLYAFLTDENRDIEIRDFTDVDVLRGDWSPLADRINRKFEGHTGRIGIHGPYEGIVLDARDPDMRTLIQSRLISGLEACKAVERSPGTAHMVVHSPYTTWDWHNALRTATECEEKVERVQLMLKDIIPRAEDMGLVIVLENIEDKDPYSRVALAEVLDSPAVRVSLDTGHAHYAHGATGAPPVDYYVRAAGDLLSHVHLHDCDGFADRHWRVGKGTIQWPSIFEALHELSEMPRLILEMADGKDILPSAEWLIEAGNVR
jgi:sugar phosphate isomerase/epimerase